MGKRGRKRNDYDRAIDVAIGQRLRSLRLMRGWSQERLGKASGITFQQIQKYENGMNRIGGSRLQQFATALNTHAGYFFGEDGSGSKPDAALDEFMALLNSSVALRMFRAVEKMLPKVRTAFVAFAESVVKK